MSTRPLRLGIAGLGRAFSLMLPTFIGDPRVTLAAATDPREDARRQFESDFGGPVYPGIEELCADRTIDAIYIASPHQFHARHVEIAANAGKHILVEKPMALDLAECRSMIDSARRAGVHLIVGHSHSFDAPILRARELIASGQYGQLRMITALNFTDFLYRPRRLEELNTKEGGGVVFSQAAHQVDIVRLLAGGKVRSVRATTGNWDPARPTEGAYQASLNFEDGCFATLTYSGYGHFDSDEFLEDIGEMGEQKDYAAYGKNRRQLEAVASSDDEALLKASRTYGGRNFKLPSEQPRPAHHQHFGLFIASCEHGDLRPTPSGVAIYGDFERQLERLPPPLVPRSEVIDELHAAVFDDRAPLHSGEWGLATTEVCLAMLQSAAENREISLQHQVGCA
ncbi:MAG: Gfo/Idh/MocA family oxidoreductase [Pseudomonadota bacterium]